MKIICCENSLLRRDAMALHLAMPQLSTLPDTTHSQSQLVPPRHRYISNCSSLTLHDYHNHQPTGAASVPIRLRRLRRKPASSDLSAELPLPTSQFLGLSQPSLTPRHSCAELHLHSAIADLGQQRATVSHSLAPTSRPQFSGHKPPDSLVYGPRQLAQPVSSNNVDDSSHLPQPNDFAYSVRSIKHSSQRQSSHNVFGDSLPRASIGSDSRIPNASLFSDTSNFSLSPFPIPPHASEPAPPNRSGGESQSNERNTPTVYRVRGASFDIINPHQFLRLQDIETPTEQDGGCAEYFHTGLMTEPSDSKAAQMTPLLLNTHGQDGSSVKVTSPRALFEDLTSANTSITARLSRKYQQTAPLSNDLPLPPVPVAVREAPSRFEEVRLTEHSTRIVVNATSSSLSVSQSFRQRLYQVFRSKKAGHGQGSANINAEIPLTLTEPSTQAHSGLHGANDKVMRDSIDDDVTDEVELGRANQLSSMSEANPSQQYYNDERYCAPSSHEESGLVATARLNPPTDASPHPAGLD